MKVALVVDSWTGYPVIVKDAKFFDEHPEGEGHDRFRLVELERQTLSMDEWYEWIPHPTLENAIVRIPKVKFNTTILRTPGFSVASNLNNKISEAALKTITVSDYQADFLAERIKYDTLRNANVTVGTGKTHASIGSGITASSSGDAVLVFATAAGFYTENVVISGVLMLKGMIANQGVLVQNSSGTVIDCSTAGTGGSSIQNLTALGSGGTPLIGYFCSGTGITLAYCVVHDVEFGFRTDGQMFQHNGLCYDCTDSGVFTTSNATVTQFVTAAGNSKNGIRTASASNVNWCRSIANTTADYIFGGALSMGNVSSDGTQPGVGGSASGTSAQFTNFAGKDFSLNISTAIKLKGTPSVGTDILLGNRKTADTDNDIWPGAFDPDLDPGVMPTEKVLSVTVTPASASAEINFTTPSGTVNKVGFAISTTAAGAVTDAIAGTFSHVIDGLTSSTAFTDYNINTTDGKTDLSSTTNYFIILVVGDDNGFATNAVLGDETSFTTLAPTATTFQIPMGLEVIQTNEVKLTVRVT